MQGLVLNEFLHIFGNVTFGWVWQPIWWQPPQDCWKRSRSHSPNTNTIQSLWKRSWTNWRMIFGVNLGIRRAVVAWPYTRLGSLKKMPTIYQENWCKILPCVFYRGSVPQPAATGMQAGKEGWLAWGLSHQRWRRLNAWIELRWVPLNAPDVSEQASTMNHDLLINSLFVACFAEVPFWEMGKLDIFQHLATDNWFFAQVWCPICALSIRALLNF